MANTITSKLLIVGKRTAVLYVALSSDGTQETGTVIYDSSVVATAFGDTDPLTSTIEKVYASCNAASTARATLLWDANTDVVAFNIPTGTNPTKACFDDIGGLPNQGGTGKTGDILLTSTGLASGDSLIMVLRIKRN